ncbi:MAG: SET domain-containing protein-lysine N-methyltransferase [Burkholderiales bacterium]|nr:SET domain-containing protein-lysine N-methyltransferase [Burkholderiales bacterium]
MPTLRPLLPQADGDLARAASAPVSRGQAANPQKYAVDVRPSAIDGLGAFALEAIAAQRKIGEIRGESVSTAEAFKRAKAAERRTGRIFMVAVSHSRAVDATESTDPLRFANHSCAPNMVLKIQQGRVAFYALRDIKVGEELTAGYGPTHHAGRLQCRCGAPGCVGQL